MFRSNHRYPLGLALALGVALLAMIGTVTVGSRATFLDTTDNVGNSLTALSCFKPAQPGSVQSGTAMSIANGTLSVSITPVDAAMSFLVFSSRHDSNRPVGSLIRGRLNAAGNAVEFVRVTNEAVPVPISIQWYVVEYSCGIRVQRGEVNQSSTTINVPITPVGSTSAAFVTWSKSPASGDGNWSQDDPVVGELTTPGNLQFRVNSANSSHVIAWQVVEFVDPLDVSVQRGTTSLLGTATSTTATLSPPVDVTKTFVLVGYRTAGGGVDIGAKMLRAELTNSTTITIDRSISGTPDDITEIVWQAVELQDGSLVQRGSEPFIAGTASATVGISTVDVTKAYAFGSVQAGSGQNMGRSPYAVDDIIGVGSFTAALSANNLTLTRDNTAAAADVGWFVVHWGTSGPSVSGLNPSSGPPAAGTSVVISGSGFTGATAVDFGAAPATGFTVDSDSQITATSPAGSGTVDVQVTTPSGMSANTGADDFTYTNTYYVRTDGADTNSGLSNTAGGAWLTIQKAASTMVAGDTVRVQPGTYPETVTPLNAGTAANQITYLADGAVVVDGGNVRCKAFEVGTGYVVIDGFEITNQPDCGGADAALNINNANNVTVRNNIIHDTGRDAVYFAGTSANGLVENNLIYNIDDDGSTPTGGGSHTFRNNTFAGTIVGWTLENGAASNLFENNIFWTSAIQNTSLGTFNYNDYNGGVLPGTGNISSDPIFVNVAAADYHLSHIAAGQASDSPAIDAGSDTATNLLLDTKTTRTDNVTDTSTVDLGYHYWVAAASPIAQVQKASAASTGADPSVIATYGTAPNQDNLLVLVHHYRDIGTVTLPAGWSEAVALVDSGSTITIGYKIAGAAEGTGVTVSVSVAAHQTLTIFEYSGIDTVSPLDQTASNPCPTAGTSCSTGTTATTVQADELIIAGIGLAGDAGSWGNTWTNGFTQQSTVASSGGAGNLRSASSTADRIVTATGTFETTESWTTSREAIGAIATFR